MMASTFVLPFLALILLAPEAEANFLFPSISAAAFVVWPSSTVAPKRHSSFLRALGAPICDYHEVSVSTTQEGPPCQKINVEDLTPTLKEMLEESGMKNGVINVISRHTTTAITINERESRLARDLEKAFLGFVPADERSHPAVATAGVRYQHNDIDERPESEEEAQRCRENGWDIDSEAELKRWRDQEPINAHSHLISMMLGSSEGIPVVEGKMVIGQWQSCLLVDLDGPRDRTVGVQLLGYK